MRSNSDLTVYHRSVVSGAESWSREEVRGVHWEDSDGAKVLPNGKIRDDKATVFVPFARGVEFAEGDVIVRGLVSDTVNATFTMSDLKQKYRDALTIRHATKRDFGSMAMRHWELSAS